MNGLAEHSSAHAALHEILLGYLRQMDSHSWPGIDGLTLEVVLACYARSAAAGDVPGKEQLLRQYPELADEIQAFFAASSSSATAPPEEQGSPICTGGIRAD